MFREYFLTNIKIDYSTIDIVILKQHDPFPCYEDVRNQ